MTIYLKQSTASQEVPLGFFVSSTDGNTEQTALSLANTDIWIWKNGATTLANKNSGGGTHIQNGIYYAVLDATDTNTLGPLVIYVHKTGALPVKLECVVLAANVFDSMIAASDNLQIDALQIIGTTLTETSAGYLAAGFKKLFDVASPVLTAASVNQTGDAYAGLTSTVADSVPSDGTRPSVQQGILMLTRLLMEKSVSGTTVTVKKEDGSTTSMTFTLNDGTSPTSITRTT
jgi:hypothetical protein